MKKLILLDLYHTLIVDTGQSERREYRINAINSALEQAGFPLRFSQIRDAYDETQVFLSHCQQKSQSLSVFDLVHYFCVQLNINDTPTLKKVYDLWVFAGLQVLPNLRLGVAEGLAQLKQEGRKIVLITNTSDMPGMTIRFLLHNWHLYSYFDDLVFSDEFGLAKSKPSIFLRVLEGLHVMAEDTLFISSCPVHSQVAEGIGISVYLSDPAIEFPTLLDRALKI